MSGFKVTLFQRKLVVLFYIFCLFFISASYITYPLIFHMGDYVSGFGDELIIAWIQNWVIHALTTNPLHLFQAPIYFPYQNTLAYSDAFITSSILSIIPIFIWKEPIVAQNFTFFSSIVLLGFSTFILTFYITKNYLSSILSGLLVQYSPAVLDKYVHTQILSIFWVPLSILIFSHYLKTGKFRFYCIFLLFFFLQTINSFLPGYFILFSVIILAAVNSGSIIKFINKKVITSTLITFAFILPLALPYYSVSNQFKYTRDIRDTIHFALQPEDLFYTNSFSKMKPFLDKLSSSNLYPVNTGYKPGFIGLTFSVLTIICFVIYLRNRKRFKNVSGFVLISLTGLFLSFGPFLHIARQTIHHPVPIPMPYLLFYYLFPGFQGFRNSARWEMLFILFISIAIGIVFFRITKKLNLTKRVIITLILLISIIAEYNFPMKFYPVPRMQDFPPVYSFLKTLSPGKPIVEMPIYNWNMQPYAPEEFKREFYSTIHFQPMLNGASGFSPPPWQLYVTTLLRTFPSEDSIRQLKNTKIKYIVVHKSEYDELRAANFIISKVKIPDGNSIINTLGKTSLVTQVEQFGND